MKYRSLMIFLLMCALMACNAVPGRVASSENTQEVSSQIECPEVMPAPKSKPVFLTRVFPIGFIKKAEFDDLIKARSAVDGTMGGIQATVEKIRSGSDSGMISASSIRLFVDRMPISQPTTIQHGLMEHGPYYYNWPVNLDPGYHVAKIEAYLDNGERVEYSWAICIVP